MEKISPTKIIVSSFALVIFIGTILLTLPISSAQHKFTSVMDALFTATTATCVTGLVVADTGTYWSLFGQLVILALIQIGGLGIITLTTFFITIIGRRFSLAGLKLVQESVNSYTISDLSSLVKKVLYITMLVEGTGAVILATRFIPQYGLWNGLYRSIFHAISAFCNAGIDVMGKNYISVSEYTNDPVVLLTIAFLIIIGGFGFIAIADLFNYKKNKGTLYSHTKIVTIMTIALLAIGTIGYMILEYSNTMEGMNFFQKILNAFFHSASARTAGFNSLDLAAFHDTTKLFTIILMFIGAAPGSTGGGVKVTTFAVLLITVISQLQGRSESIGFKRKINPVVIYKSLTIILLSGGLVALVSCILALDPAIRSKSISFIDMIFEATSAFGTVGLATYVNALLSPISKLAVIITMFLGRVGPLSFALALTIKNQNRDEMTVYPEAKIIVG